MLPGAQGGKNSEKRQWSGGTDHCEKVEKTDLKVDFHQGTNTASSPAAPRTQGCFLKQKGEKTQKKSGGRVGMTTVKNRNNGPESRFLERCNLCKFSSCPRDSGMLPGA